MVRAVRVPVVRVVRAPHARGDGPWVASRRTLRPACSPRTWGWSAARLPDDAEDVALPTHVGMVRSRRTGRGWRRLLPTHVGMVRGGLLRLFRSGPRSLPVPGAPPVRRHRLPVRVCSVSSAVMAPASRPGTASSAVGGQPGPCSWNWSWVTAGRSAAASGGRALLLGFRAGGRCGVDVVRHAGCVRDCGGGGQHAAIPPAVRRRLLMAGRCHSVRRTVSSGLVVARPRREGDRAGPPGGVEWGLPAWGPHPVRPG